MENGRIAQSRTCITHRHECGRSATRMQEDEVLRVLTVLDRNLCMGIEEMQRKSRRLTCYKSTEPPVILMHYNIPQRDIPLG